MWILRLKEVKHEESKEVKGVQRKPRGIKNKPYIWAMCYVNQKQVIEIALDHSRLKSVYGDQKGKK